MRRFFYQITLKYNNTEMEIQRVHISSMRKFKFSPAGVDTAIKHAAGSVASERQPVCKKASPLMLCTVGATLIEGCTYGAVKKMLTIVTNR
ncbi:MAG: hypothetical protein ACTHMM_26700 [Agriterribacter sp.]